MSSLEELERRIAAIEGRLEMESGLRAAADRDLSSTNAHLRAQTSVIQALAITQAEHTTAIRALREDHGAKLNPIIAMLDRLLDTDQ